MRGGARVLNLKHCRQPCLVQNTISVLIIVATNSYPHALLGAMDDSMAERADIQQTSHVLKHLWRHVGSKKGAQEQADDSKQKHVLERKSAGPLVMLGRVRADHLLDRRNVLLLRGNLCTLHCRKSIH